MVSVLHGHIILRLSNLERAVHVGIMSVVPGPPPTNSNNDHSCLCRLHMVLRLSERLPVSTGPASALARAPVDCVECQMEEAAVRMAASFNWAC